MNPNTPERPMSPEMIEGIAREVYVKDRFTPLDEVWCNLHWLRKFARAIEAHHGIK